MYKTKNDFRKYGENGFLLISREKEPLRSDSPDGWLPDAKAPV